jgi:NAD+ diphosphatase
MEHTMSSGREQGRGSADLGPEQRLGYVGGGIDRAAERRSDAAALVALANADSSRCYLVAGEAIALKKRAGAHTLDPLFTPDDLRRLGGTTDMVFLGLCDGRARFAGAIDSIAVQASSAGEEITVSGLRAIAVQGLVEAEHLPAMAEAKALLSWHARHQFCPNCGIPTALVEGGWRRDCPSCKVQHFPRTDPVVIMLAISEERCLLGRSHRFQPGMWSCLAGYVEPGESIEEAVRRETQEETGIICGKVSYFASQPWPFPTSLMIGCHAEALSQELKIDRAELDDARWFDRKELALMLARRHPDKLSTPPPVAIAYHLIRAWVEDRVAFA